MKLKDLKHIVTVVPPLYYEQEIKILSPSTFAKNALYYLYLARSIQTNFPFSLDCTAFDAYLILYTLEGTGKFTSETKSSVLSPNTILFIDCRKPFRIEIGKSNTWHFKLFIFNGSSSEAYFKQLTSNTYYLCPLVPISNIPQVTHKLLECVNDCTSSNEFIISKLITDLLTELVLNKESDLHHVTNVPKYLLEIKELFDAHYADHFSLDNLAQTYHISKYKIIRDFSTYFNSSPINYLINKRITAAKRLLLETDYPICEIASMVGIDNMNHFTNLFKKSTNLTPNTYRKTCQIEFTEFLDD